MLYSWILAGGSGTRLWPRSRRHAPKQFLPLLSERTLLQDTYSRILPFIPPERILVGTSAEFRDLVANQLPMLPVANIITEPEARRTAAAIGIAAMHVMHQDPHAVMVVLPADHTIAKVDVFRSVLADAQQLAEQDWLVTIGIHPTIPATGYGYIERNDGIITGGRHKAFRVTRFVEKPELATAGAFLRSGRYDWNSGMFVWKAERIVEELGTHTPMLYEGLTKITRMRREGADTGEWIRLWRLLPTETIDYGVMEKAQRVAVIPADIGWSDVGDWAAIYEALSHDASDNAVDGQHISPDTRRTLVISSRLVATIGLEDLVIVDTPDVLFVCPRSRAQDVKQLVALLEEQGLQEYLT